MQPAFLPGPFSSHRRFAEIGRNMCFPHDVGTIIPFLDDSGVIKRGDEVLRASGLRFQAIPDLFSGQGWDGGIRAVDRLGIGDVESEHYW